MNTKRNQTRLRVRAPLVPALVVALALLSACSDGGGTDNGGGDGIPTATVDEFSAWAASRSSDDEAEPLNVDGLSPPTSDSVEPMPIG